ncbi:hypothetical protein B0O99DRAFT_688491 [Bisporella sp. PMI_857]|nr:hypothetical protein B0O99DRAFT_688491 [Bisporella sp. PMI_857]
MAAALFMQAEPPVLFGNISLSNRSVPYLSSWYQPLGNAANQIAEGELKKNPDKLTHLRIDGSGRITVKDQEFERCPNQRSCFETFQPSIRTAYGHFHPVDAHKNAILKGYYSSQGPYWDAAAKKLKPYFLRAYHLSGDEIYNVLTWDSWLANHVYMLTYRRIFGSIRARDMLWANKISLAEPIDGLPPLQPKFVRSSLWIKQAQKEARMKISPLDAAEDIFKEIEEILLAKQVVRAAIHAMNHAHEDLWLTLFGHPYTYTAEIQESLKIWQAQSNTELGSLKGAPWSLPLLTIQQSLENIVLQLPELFKQPDGKRIVSYELEYARRIRYGVTNLTKYHVERSQQAYTIWDVGAMSATEQSLSYSPQDQSMTIILGSYPEVNAAANVMPETSRRSTQFFPNLMSRIGLKMPTSLVGETNNPSISDTGFSVPDSSASNASASGTSARGSNKTETAKPKPVSSRTVDKQYDAVGAGRIQVGVVGVDGPNKGVLINGKACHPKKLGGYSNSRQDSSSSSKKSTRDYLSGAYGTVKGKLKTKAKRMPKTSSSGRNASGPAQMDGERHLLRSSQKETQASCKYFHTWGWNGSPRKRKSVLSLF